MFSRIGMIVSFAFIACEPALGQGLDTTSSRPWFRPGELWEGEGFQPGHGTWSIEITFNVDGSATIDYPSIPCGGALTPLSSSLGRAVFRETITRSPGRCTNHGTVTLSEEESGRLDYVYESPRGSISRGGLALAASPAATTTQLNAADAGPKPRPITSVAISEDAEARLRADFPTFYQELQALAGAEPHVAELATRAAATLLNMAYSPVMNQLIFNKVGVEGRLLAEWALQDPDAFLAASRSTAGEVGTDMALDGAVHLAAHAMADATMNAPGFDELDPMVAAIVHGLVTGTIKEGWWFAKTASNGDPSDVFSGAINRGLEVVEIYQSTRDMLETQDQAFIATALALQTSVELEVTSDRESSRAVAEEIYQTLVSNSAEIYGSDDAAALRQILDLARTSLRAVMRGNIDEARVARDAMLRTAGRSGNIGPLTLLANPRDWLDAAGNWGKDAPPRAAEILVRATRIAELDDPTAPAPEVINPFMDGGPLVSASTYELEGPLEALGSKCGVPQAAGLLKWSDLGTGAAEVRRYVWTGNCTDGKPSGWGQVAALDQQQGVVWYWVFAPGSLFAWGEEGFVVGDPALPDHKIQCPSRAHIDGSGAIRAADLANDGLLKLLFKRAAEELIKECNIDHNRRLFLGFGQPSLAGSTHGSPSSGDTSTFVEYRNLAAEDRRAKVREINLYLRNKRLAAARAQKQQVAAERRKQEAELEERRRTAERAEQERRQQAIAEQRAKILAEWAARVEGQLAGNAPIENLADLLKHDRLRTLQSLSEGRAVRIAITEPGFRGGQFVVVNRQKAFDVDEALAGSEFSWANWIRMTQHVGGGNVEVVCLFQGDAIGALQQGQTYTVQAKLLEASGGGLVMQCTP